MFLVARLDGGVCFCRRDSRPRETRLSWWHDAKFGMFIHWGIYAIPGRGATVHKTEFEQSGGVTLQL
jgi:hypothetical protein